MRRSNNGYQKNVKTMIQSLIALLQNSLSYVALLSLFSACVAFAAVVAEDDESDDDLDDPDLNLNFSAESLREYQETVKETDACIAELVDELDSDSTENRCELLEELAQCYLQNAARAQEEGDSERRSHPTM